MAGRGLEDRLVASGALRREAVQMARRRQKVYGGGLDTVLLEMGLVDEGTLWALLVQDTGLAPLPPALFEGSMAAPELLVGHAEARRLGAFAFKAAGTKNPGLTQAVARPGFDQKGMASVLADHSATLYIVPEVRFEALLGSLYAHAIPPRFVSLLGRLMGPEQLRRWSATTAPKPRLQAPPVDVGPRYRPTAAESRPSEMHAPFPLAPTVSQPVIYESAPLTPSQHAEAEIPVALPVPRAGHDDLLAALIWLADLEGGPRAAGVAAAVANHWTAGDIFCRLPQLAKRGENVARAVLPLLASQGNLDFLADQMHVGQARERRWAVLAVGIFLRANSHQRNTDVVGRAINMLCHQLERDPEPEIRAAAAHGLRGFSSHREVRNLIERLAQLIADPTAIDAARVGAAILLGEMRIDEACGVQGLIEGAGAKSRVVSETCHAALVRITAANAGAGRARWRRWWKTHCKETRLQWLVGALQSRHPDLRLMASNELTDASGQTFGFYFDLPPAARKAAVTRWKHWLETSMLQ